MNRQQEFESIFNQMNPSPNSSKKVKWAVIIGMISIFMAVSLMVNQKYAPIKPPEGYILIQTRLKSYLPPVNNRLSLATLYLHKRQLIDKLYIASEMNQTVSGFKKARLYIPQKQLQKIIPYLESEDLKLLPYSISTMTSSAEVKHEVIF